jgi:hypothetical protein
LPIGNLPGPADIGPHVPVEFEPLPRGSEAAVSLRVLMFGWEFPPFQAGGLGTATLGLVKGLARQGASVTLVSRSGPARAAWPTSAW